MSATRRFFDTTAAQGKFRRNHRSGVFMGVCAGVADYLGLDRTVVRLVTLLLLWLAAAPTLLFYLLLAWLGDTP